MSFKSEEFEFSFTDVVKLFSEFNNIQSSHVQSISGPQGGECFWVFNTDPKKKGNY